MKQILLLTAALVVTAFISPLRAAERPNILFILSDDHAQEAIGAYGSWLKDYVQTPVMDKLAAEGMRFTNMCVNNSICSPSRAAILTGQYSHKNGVRNLGGAINASSPMFSEELRRAGYQTAVFGKWHLSSEPRGFDDYAITRGQGSYFNPSFETPAGQKKFTGYYADIYTDVSLDWLKQRDKSKPFALCVHYKGPHHFYEYPERHAKLLEGVTVPEPPTLHEDVEQTSPQLKAVLPQQMNRNKSYYDRHKNEAEPRMEQADDPRGQASAAYQHMLHKYIRCVAAIDDNMQRLFDYLAADQITDDTLIIYTSDQGYWLGQHGLYDKRLILDESLKMPLIVRYPKLVKPGTVDHHMCSNVDFATTLLEFAGVEVPAAMQGRSLWPILRGESPSDWREAIWYSYWGAPPNHWGIRTADSTLVRFPDTDEFEFYDLVTDPLQTRSVHADPAYAQRIAQAQELLAATMLEVDMQPSELPGSRLQSRESANSQKKTKRKRNEK